MKLKLLVVLLASIFFKMNGQELELRYSNPVKVGAYAQVSKSVEYEGKLLMLWWSHVLKRSELNLKVYDAKTLAMERSNPLIGSCRSKDKDCFSNFHYDYEGFITMKSGIYLLNNSYFYEEDKLKLFAQKLDKTGSFSGDNTLLTSTYSKSPKKSGSFHISVSPDSSTLLVVERVLMQKKATSQVFGINIYDNNLKNIKQFNVEFPFSEDEMSVARFLVDNNGFAYLLASIPGDEKKEKKGYFSLYVIDSETRETKELRISLENKEVVSAGMVLDKLRDKIIITGTYIVPSEKKNEYRRSGLYFLKYDPISGRISDEQERELKDAIVATNDARKGRKEERTIDVYGMTLADMSVNEDGSSYFTFEYRIRRECSDKNGRWFVYENGNIIDVKVAEDGYINSVTLIPKHQASLNFENANSYFVIKKDGKRIFLFNDHYKNYTAFDPKGDIKSGDLESIYTLSLNKNAVLVQAVVNEDGTCKQSVLIGQEDYTKVLCPVSAVELGGGEIAVHAMTDKGRGCTCMHGLLTYGMSLAKISVK